MDRSLSQMGLDQCDCERYSESSPERREAEIGVYRPAPKGGPGFYVYLWWREIVSDTPEIMGAIVLEFWTKKARDEIRDRFRRGSPGCRAERGGSDN